MGADNEFTLHFWGTRGTIAMPGPSTQHYGGHTSCVEVRCNGQTIILDAGTGLKPLGDVLQNKHMDILLSHTHIDHIIGLPFFAPAYTAGRSIGIWAGHLQPEHTIRDVIGQLMSPPIFPLTAENFHAAVTYTDFSAGETLHTDHWHTAGIRIKTLPLAHPDRATGYRIECGHQSVCYITDYEHVPGVIDKALVDFVQGTDCLIYDSTYSDENFERYKGWGHSTWQQAVRLADAAGVKRLVTFHHDPDADDNVLQERALALEKMRPGSIMAQDGMELKLQLPEASQLSYRAASPAADEPAAVKLVERLTAIGMALSVENDLDRLLEIILVEAQNIAGADGGTLYYRNEDDRLEFSIIRNNTLNIAFGGSTGKKAPMEPLYLFNPATGAPNSYTLAAFAVLMKKPVNIDDVYAAEGFDFEGAKAFDKHNNYRTHSVLAIPMINHKKEAIGCLQLINARDDAGNTIPFSSQTRNLIQALASQAAIILDNKKLIQAQKDLLESFIKMIAKAIDAKSPYTGAHCERVPTLTNMLAEAACNARDGLFRDFNLSDEEKYELHIAGWMHDCGKVTTPMHIMDKATKLETISDRIELVKTRFALFRRDARIAMLERLGHAGADRKIIEQDYQQKIVQLDGDLAFICNANIGGEFMSDADLARLKEIAQSYTWNEAGQAHSALTDNEVYNLSTRRGTLTHEERQIMNDHMVHTCQMLEALPFPKHLKRVPEYAGGHHERMDGKGYPKGIKAGKMSVPARMMAVADVFEALTASDRPYKPAKKLSEAMKIISDMKKHNHLDPDIVDFFVTSKVYLDYARRYLSEDLIDSIDEAEILAAKPVPM